MLEFGKTKVATLKLVPSNSFERSVTHELYIKFQKVLP